MNDEFDFLIFTAIFTALTTLSIGVTAALVKIVCWSFGLTFRWRYAIGIWSAIVLLYEIFKGNSK